ncbi:MAG: DUF1343 domain-containing protein [Bacteroidetes bacterium]|nr:DUF1343 domain-containing protein [Bacteroidota bacterium]
MRYLLFIILLCFWSSSISFASVFQTKQDTIHFLKRESKLIENDSFIITGAEQTQLYLPIIKTKTIALIVNQTSVIGKTHLVDTLLKLGIKIKTIFAPEHGFRGDHSAGAIVNSGVDPQTGIKITSLYGKNKKPSKAQLKGIDFVIFDIQDVGVRFYTYISTMHYAMEACAENNIPFIVLDRPNPNGYYVDGPVLDTKFKSFIGMHPVPLVHGATVGEFAQMINGEKWLDGGKKCKLTIIKLKNYNHRILYKCRINPSPNLQTPESIYLYPSLGLFEGTIVSVGRGTPKPFEWLGYPGSSHGNTTFTPKKIPGIADDPPYEGKECKGILLTEFCNHYLINSKQLYIDWLILFYKNKKADTKFFIESSFDRLAGSDALRKQIIEGKSSDDIRKSWQEDLKKYEKIRSKYLLYEL